MALPFRSAVESGDVDALVDTLAPDIVFRSPVVFKPYEGRETVGALLRAVVEVFEDFRYEAEIEQGERTALIFRARVGDREVEGVDLIRSDAEGLVAELVVMVRPMSGVLALAEAMRAKLEEHGVIPAGA